MSDQGVYWKLWIASYDDPDLSIMPIEDFGRWAKFGVYTKRHGENGIIVLTRPPKHLTHPLQAAFQVDNFDAIIACIRRFCTCDFEHVTDVTTENVTYTIKWRNWRKFQGDYSGDRVRKHRAKKSENVTHKKRREEKREEEKNKSYDAHPENGFSAWPGEWTPIRDMITGPNALPFLARHASLLCDLDWWVSMKELFSGCPVSLERLLADAAAFVQGEGYKPRSRAAIKQKLKNCLEYSAKKSERGFLFAPQEKPVSKYPKL